MTFKKGEPRPERAGRAKGVPNKATARAQEAIGLFVEANISKFSKWLDEIYEADGPKAAFGCVESVIEYHIPKLARNEQRHEGQVDLIYTMTPRTPLTAESHIEGA